MSWDRFLYALKYSGDWTWLAVAIRQPALHETQMAPYLVARMARLLDLSAPTLGMLSPGWKGSSWISAVDFKPKPPLPQKLKTTHPAQAFWQTTFPRTFIYTDSEDQVIPGHRENIKLTQPGKVTWLIKQLVAQDHYQSSSSSLGQTLLHHWMWPDLSVGFSDEACQHGLQARLPAPEGRFVHLMHKGHGVHQAVQCSVLPTVQCEVAHTTAEE